MKVLRVIAEIMRLERVRNNNVKMELGGGENIRVCGERTVALVWTCKKEEQ